MKNVRNTASATRAPEYVLPSRRQRTSKSATQLQGPLPEPLDGPGDGDSSKYEVVERFLNEGRRYKLLPDYDDPQRLLEQYDSIRENFCIIFWMAIVFALAITVLAMLPFFVQITDDPKVSSEGTYAFSIHQVCMITSMLILSSFGILIYRLLPEVNPWYLKFFHGGIFSIVTSIMTFGFVKILQSHGELSKQNFGSIHSWLGISVVFLFYVEFLTGFIYLTGIPVRCDFLGPKFQKFHKTLGLSVLFLSCVAVVTGICQTSFYLNLSMPVMLNPGLKIFNVQGLLVLCFFLAVGSLLFDQKFRRRARPNWKCIYRNSSASGIMGNDSSKTLISKDELFQELLQVHQEQDMIKSGR